MRGYVLEGIFRGCILEGNQMYTYTPGQESHELSLTFKGSIIILNPPETFDKFLDHLAESSLRSPRRVLLPLNEQNHA